MKIADIQVGVEHAWYPYEPAIDVPVAKVAVLEMTKSKGLTLATIRFENSSPEGNRQVESWVEGTVRKVLPKTLLGTWDDYAPRMNEAISNRTEAVRLAEEVADSLEALGVTGVVPRIIWGVSRCGFDLHLVDASQAQVVSDALALAVSMKED